MTPLRPGPQGRRLDHLPESVLREMAEWATMLLDPPALDTAVIGVDHIGRAVYDQRRLLEVAEDGEAILTRMAGPDPYPVVVVRLGGEARQREATADPRPPTPRPPTPDPPTPDPRPPTPDPRPPTPDPRPPTPDPRPPTPDPRPPRRLGHLPPEVVAEMEERGSLLLDPPDLDRACVGIDQSGRAVYDEALLLMALASTFGGDEEERQQLASDWYDYNIVGCMGGPGDPITIVRLAGQ